jgi:hypothetical protein
MSGLASVKASKKRIEETTKRSFFRLMPLGLVFPALSGCRHFSEAGAGAALTHYAMEKGYKA